MGLWSLRDPTLVVIGAEVGRIGRKRFPLLAARCRMATGHCSVRGEWTCNTAAEASYRGCGMASHERGQFASEDGASAVEFAIVAPLLFTLLFGIIYFGIIFAQDLALGNGARQGARAGAVAINDCQAIIAEAELGATAIGLDPSNVSFDIDVYRSTDNPAADPEFCQAGNPTGQPCLAQPVGTEVQVFVSYDAPIMIPFVRTGTVHLDREGSYRCEYQ